MTTQESDLQQAFKEIDDWFTQFVAVNEDAHKELKALLLRSVKNAKNLDYLVDLSGRKLVVVIYLDLWRIFFSRTNKLTLNVLNVLSECLPDYQISVSVARFRKPIAK